LGKKKIFQSCSGELLLLGQMQKGKKDHNRLGMLFFFGVFLFEKWSGEEMNNINGVVWSRVISPLP
jgi:hypothetical protein